MNEGSVELVNRAIELAPAKLLDVDGFTHIDKDKTVTMFTPPVPKTTGVSTLAGFVSLLEEGIEAFDPTLAMVHVREFNRVVLADRVSDTFGRRQHFVEAVAPKPEREFAFNTYIGQEEFNINLRSMFVQTDHLDELVALAGNIAKISEMRQEDDGFSQTVNVKGGVTLVKAVTLKPRVTLKPFRTFLEVDQPAGDYIFRVGNDERRGNLCALFEADAGRWKLTAMDTIKVWLTQQIGTSEVEAIRSIPVIA